MHTNYLGLFIVVAFVIGLSPMEALGQSASSSVDTPFDWKIRTFFEDVWVDNFLVAKEKKAEAYAKQAEGTQELIERFASEGKQIPVGFLHRVNERLVKAETVLTEIDDSFQPRCLLPPCERVEPVTKEEKDLVNSRINTGKVVDELRKVSEVNKIRLLINDFNTLREKAQSGELNNVQVTSEANRIDKEVNELKIIDEHCKDRISSLDLAYEKSPYKKLQDNCEILKNYSLEEAQSRLKLIGADIG